MLRKMKLVCEIAQKHYEPGNYTKSYYQVWKNYVYPVYPCCYNTFLKYINTPLGALKEQPEDDPRQLNLFDE